MGTEQRCANDDCWFTVNTPAGTVKISKCCSVDSTTNQSEQNAKIQECQHHVVWSDGSHQRWTAPYLLDQVAPYKDQLPQHFVAAASAKQLELALLRDDIPWLREHSELVRQSPDLVVTHGSEAAIQLGCRELGGQPSENAAPACIRDSHRLETVLSNCSADMELPLMYAAIRSCNRKALRFIIEHRRCSFRAVAQELLLDALRHGQEPIALWIVELARKCKLHFGEPVVSAVRESGCKPVLRKIVDHDMMDKSSKKSAADWLLWL